MLREFPLSSVTSPIVIGTYGRNKWPAFILGSVALSLVHKDMHLPVLVIRNEKWIG